ncbi:MAG: cadmium-translocating P-type ATPase [Oscillospiraceae bacterium]|jgi:Cd2+/Zn2+-exporting ATPase|nr:cadmium-translocating P-type ATPase [Oscillospiraceae bacterium]
MPENSATLYLKGLDCPNCAMKIETKISELDYMRDVSLNFSTGVLKYNASGKYEQEIFAEIEKIVHQFEPDVMVQREKKPDESEHGKGDLIRVIISGGIFLAALFVPFPEYGKIIAFAAAALLCGYGTILNGIKNLFKFQIEEHLLMTVAVIAAFAIGEYPEGCIVMLMFSLGEYIEGLAVARSRRDIKKLTEIRPDTARLVSGGEIPAEEVKVGDLLEIRAGERIPLDCRIIKGNSSIDTSAMTGESIPVSVNNGDFLLSGTVNQSGLLECEVTSTFYDSAATRVLRLVEEAVGKKSSAERFITRFAKVYTPVVIIAAVLISVLPPLFNFGGFGQWFNAALVFLVSSCPCAFVIAVPLGFYSAIGAASKMGVLVKGAKYLEVLSKIDTVILDKTGTLTEGKLYVRKVISLDSSKKEEEISRLAALLESRSNHPIAKSVVDNYAGNTEAEFESYLETPGLGVKARFNNKNYLCGSEKLMQANNISTQSIENANIYISEENKIIGLIFIEDKIKPSAKIMVKRFKKLGINRIIMLTGDNEEAAKKVAEICGIKKYKSRLLPEEKVEVLSKINKTSKVSLFVGDGINDAPVLAMADIGASIGLGSDIAIEASDVVLMADGIKVLPDAVALSRRAVRTIKALIIFAMAVKFAVLALALLQIANMWMAVFADVGVTIIAVLLAARILNFYKTSKI